MSCARGGRRASGRARRGALVALAAVALRAAAGPARAEDAPWPRLDVAGLPAAWRGEAAPGEGRWRAATRVLGVADVVTATLVALAGPDGAEVALALPRLPVDGPLPRALPGAGAEVRLEVVARARGGEAAVGLALRDGRGRLLVLVDDGGAGPALRGVVERDDVTVDAALDAAGRATLALGRGNDACAVRPGAPAALGRSGLACTLLAARRRPDGGLDVAWVLYRVAGG